MTHPSATRWLRLALRFGLCLACLVTLGMSVPSASSAPPYFVYLPSVMRNTCFSQGQAIFGCVEQNGARVAGVPFTLYYYKSPATRPTSQVITNSDGGGYFGFDGAPGASSADTYLAEFSNTTDPSRLKGWHATFGADPNVQSDLGVVDITNVPLFAPANGVHITLPYTFTWGARDSSPHDRYLFFMVDPNNDHVQYQSQLEHVGSLPVTSLPFGFQYGIQYKWLIHILFDNASFEDADSFAPSFVTFDSPTESIQTRPANPLAELFMRTKP